MAKETFNEEDGVWRTVGGRRIFIRNGQSLADAMVKSGKFKSGLRETYQKEESEHVKDNGSKKEEYAKKVEEANKKYQKAKTEPEWERALNEETLWRSQYDYTKNKEDNFKNLYDNPEEYKGDNSDLEGKHIAKKESNWRDQVKANNEQLEKDLEEYKNTHDMVRDNEGYYELFRENERKNAKIKQEEPDEKYEPLEAYATYKEKREKLEPRDEEGNWKDATWTGKEYTNDEFMENLEDENWHTERKMLLDAGLTNKQMEFVKNNTTFHNGSPSLDKEIVEELIKGSKGEKFRTPEEIKTTRKNNEIERLSKDLETASKNGTSGMTTSYDNLKERYKNLTGKEFDDSNIKIPYDSKKEYKDRAGNVINQDLIKDHLAGFSANEVKNRIESEKNFLMNYKPEDREINNAYIKEMEKYYNNMEINLVKVLGKDQNQIVAYMEKIKLKQLMMK